MDEAIYWYRKVVTERYADFEGRARRSEFWYFVLMYFVILFALAFLQGILGVRFLAGFFHLAMIVPGLAVGARRLHDIGKSGWLQLLGLIPIVGVVLLIYWWAQPGIAGPNRYGADPKASMVTPGPAAA